MQPLVLHRLSFVKMQIKVSLCRIPSWAQTLNPLCCGSSMSFSRKLSIQAIKDPALRPLPLSLFTALPSFSSPPFCWGYQCVAMETATWVCCSCLSFRCKRCTTHLTISWWMEGWWLRGTVRCLVARTTTFSLCRYSTACAWLHCSEASTTFCLAACSFTIQPVPGHA